MSCFNTKTVTNIILVRHGESLANARRVYLGHLDWELTERGLMQAGATAAYLSGEQIDAVYSSDLKRAYSTALPHAQMRSLPVITSKALREIYIGLWEGVEISELETVWHDEFLDGWTARFGTFTPPEGESIPTARDRMYSELVRIAKENVGKTVLVASHAAAIRALWGRVAGIKPENMGTDSTFPTNASVTRISFDGERLLPIEYSYDAHLSGV